jgi:hypothetical protein
MHIKPNAVAHWWSSPDSPGAEYDPEFIQADRATFAGTRSWLAEVAGPGWVLPNLAVPKVHGRPVPLSNAHWNALTQKCVDQLRLPEVLTYQPVSRYWALQWYETAIFLGAALILAGVCLWWVRHRIS